jgi:hypothetical protein
MITVSPPTNVIKVHLNTQRPFMSLHLDEDYSHCPKIHSRKKQLLKKGVKMTTAKWIINTAE